MLQEELRRYRQRAGEQEAALSAKERQLVALRDELQHERQRLRECSVSPGQLLQERQFRQMLQDRWGAGTAICSMAVRNDCYILGTSRSPIKHSSGCTSALRPPMCREGSIRQLEQRAGVLEKAKDASERRLRNDLAAERRQQAELKQQMKQLQVGCCSASVHPHLSACFAEIIIRSPCQVGALGCYARAGQPAAASSAAAPPGPWP